MRDGRCREHVATRVALGASVDSCRAYGPGSVVRAGAERGRGGGGELADVGGVGGVEDVVYIEGATGFA